MSDQRTVMLENVAPIEKGDFTDLSKQCRTHSLFAALENAMQILGNPFDYDLLMGVSAHAFRLMIYKSGVYIEPPHDGEEYYLRHHTLPAIGYGLRTYRDPHDDGSSPEEIDKAIRESLDRGTPVLVRYALPDWGVIVGYKDPGYIVNTYDGTMIETGEVEGGLYVLDTAPHVQLADSIHGSFQIATNYAFRKRMPKSEKSWFGKYHSGISAYGAWISHLERNRVEDKFANWWNYGTLLDARRAAVGYLAQAKQVYAGSALQQLEELISMFKDTVSFLHQNLEYFPRREDIGEFTGGAVATLETVRQMEEDAFTSIKNSDLAAH